jgi:hypothetical protein
LSEVVKASKVGIVVGSGGNALEYNIFFCVCKTVGGLGGVTWGYVFTWAYVVVICSRPEFLQVA